MAIPSYTVNLSQLQSEFGGSTPIKISEYYRDPQKTTSYLQDNGLDMSGTTFVHTSTTNAAVPISGPISFSNFRNTKEYQVLKFGWPGTLVAPPPPPPDPPPPDPWGGYSSGPSGNPEIIPINPFMTQSQSSIVPLSTGLTIGWWNFTGNANGFERVDGAIWRDRWQLTNATSFSIPYPARARIPAVYTAIYGYFDGGSWKSDTDYSQVAYPGYRIRGSDGIVYVAAYADLPPTWFSLSGTINEQTVYLPMSGNPYILDVFVEGYHGVSAGPPGLQFNPIDIFLASD